MVTYHGSPVNVLLNSLRFQSLCFKQRGAFEILGGSLKLKKVSVYGMLSLPNVLDVIGPEHLVTDHGSSLIVLLGYWRSFRHCCDHGYI
jgi:hypothetical protein